MPKFAIIIPHDGKTISVYKTREEAEKKARYSNIFKVIELPEKKITLDKPTTTGVISTHAYQNNHEGKEGHSKPPVQG